MKLAYRKELEDCRVERRNLKTNLNYKDQLIGNLQNRISKQSKEIKNKVDAFLDKVKIDECNRSILNNTDLLNEKYIDWDSFKKEGQRYQEQIDELKKQNQEFRDLFKKKGTII